MTGCFGGDPSGDAAGGPETQSPVDAPGVAVPPSEAKALVFRPPEYGTGSPMLLNASAWTERSGQEVPELAIRSTRYRSFEPTIGITPTGDVYMGAYEQTRFLVRSEDDLATWSPAGMTIGDTRFPRSSGDPYLHVDPETGRVFNVHLWPSAGFGSQCHFLTWTDDNIVWSANPVACGQPVSIADHQTLWTAEPRVLTTVGYDRIVHLCTNRVADTTCAQSLDGGQTFGPWSNGVFIGPEPDNFDPPNELGICSGQTGHGEADLDGRVFLARARCGIPTIAVSDDDGLTWSTYVIAEQPVTYSTTGALSALGGQERFYDHEVALAVDDSGIVYAVWIGGEDGQPYLAASLDHGTTWSRPLRVAPPVVNMTWLPTVAAGERGRVAVVFYGTESGRAHDEMDLEDRWNAYATIIVDAHDDPLAVTVPFNDLRDPMMRGQCFASRCPGALGADGVGDFIDATVGSDGRLYAALVDTCTGPCIEGGSVAQGVGVVGVLMQGFSLRGESLGPLAWPPQPANETLEASGRLTASALPFYMTDPFNTVFHVGAGATGLQIEVDWTAEAGGAVVTLWEGGDVKVTYTDASGRLEERVDGAMREGPWYLNVETDADGLLIEWDARIVVAYEA